MAKKLHLADRIVVPDLGSAETRPIGVTFDCGDYESLSIQYDVLQYSGSGVATATVQTALSASDTPEWASVGSDVGLGTETNKSYATDIASGLRKVGRVVLYNVGGTTTYGLRITVLLKRRAS